MTSGENGQVLNGAKKKRWWWWSGGGIASQLSFQKQNHHIMQNYKQLILANWKQIKDQIQQNYSRKSLVQIYTSPHSPICSLAYRR